MSGIEFVEHVRQHHEWQSIPIVVVAADELTPEDKERLGSSVEAILYRARNSQEALLEQVRDQVSQGTRMRRGR